MSLASLIGKYKPQIDKGIEEELARRLIEVKSLSPHLSPVIEAMIELSRGGKRMRGLLTILGYRLAGEDKSEEAEIIKAAVVMELFHLGLLIHDDVMDNDVLRRGVATVQARYEPRHIGESVAMCAGDLTFGYGMEIVAGLEISPERVKKAIQVWGRYFSRVGYGQVLDVTKVADEASLLAILSLKSGEYSCVLPLVFGATLAGNDSELIKKLTEYGMELGWVFQLRDDYLAEWGESSKTGKPVGNDSREGKHSFALLYGREKLLSEISRHVSLAKDSLQGREFEDKEVLFEIVDWLASRDN